MWQRRFFLHYRGCIRPIRAGFWCFSRLRCKVLGLMIVGYGFSGGLFKYSTFFLRFMRFIGDINFTFALNIHNIDSLFLRLGTA
jgi:hypothetical protein